MEVGFNENEIKGGLLSKIAYYFDNGSPTLEPANQFSYSTEEK